MTDWTVKTMWHYGPPVHYVARERTDYERETHYPHAQFVQVKIGFASVKAAQRAADALNRGYCTSHHLIGVCEVGNVAM